MIMIIICISVQPSLELSKKFTAVPVSKYQKRPERVKMKAGDIQKSVEPLDSGILFKGQSCIFIEHNGELYTLRITSNDKLILTK